MGVSLLVVFLLLAALYESWAVPLAVLLVVPLGVLGSVLLTMLRGLSAGVYFNVGLITIIGLAAKNAIRCSVGVGMPAFELDFWNAVACRYILSAPVARVQRFAGGRVPADRRERCASGARGT